MKSWNYVGLWLFNLKWLELDAFGVLETNCSVIQITKEEEEKPPPDGILGVSRLLHWMDEWCSRMREFPLRLEGQCRVRVYLSFI